MILDDGGDLTKIIHEEYPDLLMKFEDYPRKLQLVF